jgi:hypothetical protein
MQEGNRRIIAAADEAARRIKLHPGMTLAHAQSLVPDLYVVEAAPQEDEAALEQLGLWCTRYSPLVTSDPPDGEASQRRCRNYGQQLVNERLAAKDTVMVNPIPDECLFSNRAGRTAPARKFVGTHLPPSARSHDRRRWRSRMSIASASCPSRALVSSPCSPRRP